MEIQHVYVHAGEEEGAGRGEKWLPLHLGEMKSPQSPERRKTLAGQKSNSQGRLRETERGKSTKLFLPSGRLCMWSNRRPGVETLSYCI